MKLIDACFVSCGKSKYNHKYFLNHIGAYSVFSSQTSNDGEIAKINSSDFTNATGVTWTKDGIYAGTVFKRVCCSFSMTTHCGFIEIKDPSKLLLDYLYLYLRFNLKFIAVGEQNKRITEEMINEFDIPEYANLEYQRQYIEEMQKICKIIDFAKNTIDSINETKDSSFLENDFAVAEYKISDLITIGASNAGNLTQKFVNENKGNIPVYGASEKDIPSYGFISDNLPKINYFEDSFRYNRNGSHGVFFTKGRFTISSDVRVFVINNNYLPYIDPEYLIIKLKEVFIDNDLSYGNKAGKDRFNSLKIKLVDLNVYSKEQQNKIARRFNEISRLKERVVKGIQHLI